MHRAAFIFVLGLLATLTACGGNAQPVVFTLEPTTPVPASSETPTAISVANIPVYTATFQPATTPTLGPSPTNLLAPTRTPAPATLTATREPTLAGLTVEYFTTDSEAVTPGDNVTLFWSVKGADQAQIYRVNDDGERIYRWDVEAQGKITVGTRASDRDVARFVLTADMPGTNVEQELLIPLRCADVWFFEPPPEACSATDPQVSDQVEQNFEHGRMIWVAAEDRIYVIFEDDRSPQWAQYPDDFEEGQPERDESLVPPSGMLQPMRGFGKVWRENENVRNRLGWAAGPEVSYEGMYQSDSAEPSVATLYLRMLNGGILALNAESREWEMLPPPAEIPPG